MLAGQFGDDGEELGRDVLVGHKRIKVIKVNLLFLQAAHC
jgi:hypothetical protein